MPDSDRPDAPLPPESVLTALVAHHVCAAPGVVRLVPCDTGKFNTTFFVEGTSQPLVLRIAPPDDPEPLLFYEYRMMRQEPDLHALIRSRTDVRVPAIVAHDDSHSTIARDYLIMERLPGTPLSEHNVLSPSLLTCVLEQVGDALRQVHEIRAQRYGYVGPHAPMEPQSDWTSAFVIMWHRLIDDTLRCGGYSREDADHMRRLLDRHTGAFDHDPPSCLLHMDVWGQNILADERGRLTGLLDWDRALWGDPEIEFAVLDYCGISEPPFWAGYGSPRDTSRAARTRQVFYFLYEVQKYILIRRLRTRSPDAAEEYRRQVFQIAGELA